MLSNNTRYIESVSYYVMALSKQTTTSRRKNLAPDDGEREVSFEMKWKATVFSLLAFN